MIYRLLGHVGIVNLLAQNGAQLNEVHGSKNRTALHLASQKGRDKIAKALLDHGANLNLGKCVKLIRIQMN